MTGCVCGAAVHLTRIFTGESATAMRTLAAISIYNNLTPCQTGIPMRTSDYKFTRRINVIFNIIVKQRQHFLMMDRSDDTRHQNIDNIVADDTQHLFIRFQLSCFAVISGQDEIIMLGGNDNRIDADGITVIIIFNGYLALGIRTKISHCLTFTTDICQYLQNTVSKVQ